MAKTREIKRRIKAVGNIKRITKTMQMIATVRFQASQRRAVSARPYTRKIAELVAELAAAAGEQADAPGTHAPGTDGAGFTHPLLNAPSPKTNRLLLLVITSNRGLCGGYNANILRTANQFLREHAGQQIDLEVVGKKGQAFFKFAGKEVAQAYGQFGDTPKYEDVASLADHYMEVFSQGQYDAIWVVHMGFESMVRESPQTLQFLPLENPTAKPAAGKQAAKVQYDLSPSAKELLDELLPIFDKTQLFQAFNEAVVSEQIARMVAMKAATDAAGKMGKELNRRYNRARQAAITTELSEIISGAAALA